MHRKVKRSLFLILFVFLFSQVSFTEELPPLPHGPMLLTSATPEMMSADYWINRLPDPNRVIKTPEQLKKFNEEIHHMIKERVNVFKMGLNWPGNQIRDQIQLEYNAIKGRALFDVNNKRVPKTIFEETIKPIVNVGKVPTQIKMKWGVAVRPTSVRALPTDIKMLEEVGDVEFDQLQFTLIKLWTPVGIYHTSGDGQWLYIQAPYTRGWVKAKDIALFETRDKLKQYTKSDNFLAVTGESIPVFTDTDLAKVILKPTMGTLLPIAEVGQRTYVVWMPSRKKDGSVAIYKGYVNQKSDVTKGFMPYTQANVIRQAFKLLAVRYGWGGMYNGRDCSGFTHDVFLSIGVDMPRDSKQQGYIGTQLDHFQPFMDQERKLAALRSARPGITILRTSKHVMLYLGEINGEFYIIHSTWSERYSMNDDSKNRINQVVVTDMALNGKSYLGSLFERMVSANEVD